MHTPKLPVKSESHSASTNSQSNLLELPFPLQSTYEESRDWRAAQRCKNWNNTGKNQQLPGSFPAGHSTEIHSRLPSPVQVSTSEVRKATDSLCSFWFWLHKIPMIMLFWKCNLSGSIWQVPIRTGIENSGYTRDEKIRSMSENEVVKAQDEHLQGNVVVKQHSYLKKVLLTLLCSAV